MPFPRQQIELVGNLGRDPEMRFTPTGQAVTQFSLAVTRQWGQGDAKQKETIWVQVSTWDKLAETVAKELSKGQQVLVKGYLKPDTQTGGPRVWARRDGTSGASFELTAQEVWKSVFGDHSASNDEPQYTEAEENIPF